MNVYQVTVEFEVPANSQKGAVASAVIAIESLPEPKVPYRIKYIEKIKDDINDVA